MLYRCSLQDSQTWKTLREQVDPLRPLVQFRLLVCDNGPASKQPLLFPDWIEYALANENRGLAWAYQEGLSRALRTHAEWLLTLDQDTSLPPSFLQRMVDLASSFADREKVGAVVPQLVGADGKAHSPAVGKLGRNIVVARGFDGLGEGDVRPFNSAALVRVAALTTSGGYDRRFWLDYLDHATFHALTRSGYKIWIAGDLQVRHKLSLHDERSSLGESRFEGFLRAESAFRDLHSSWLEGFLLNVRLLVRCLNQRRRGDPAHFVRSTLAVLRDRVTLSRAQRIAKWEREIAPMQSGPQITMIESGDGVQNSYSAPAEHDT